jgi:hypothetical protein
MGLRMKFNLVLLLAFAGRLGAGGLSDRPHPQAKRPRRSGPKRPHHDGKRAGRSHLHRRTCQTAADLADETAVPTPNGVGLRSGQSFKALRTKFPDYTYKEAALNPTNPNDRASDWEADIINEFRNNADHKELSGRA